MSEIKTELNLVKDFIFNDEVSNLITEINQNFLDFNILEITGMGTQEIKHSSILAWLFGDNEHNLSYEIFTEFLKKIYIENQDMDRNWDDLQKYIYLDEKEDLNIQREQNNIDLLVADRNNKKVFVFENKVFTGERKDGLDGGQLNKYEVYVERKYKGYSKYYIFLTPDLQEATKEKWLLASYQMLSDVLSNKIEHKELLINTRLVLESYIDLLKRRGIVAKKDLEELCQRIWSQPEYKQALEIIYNNKPNHALMIRNCIGSNLLKEKKYANVYNFFIKFHSESPYIFRLVYNTKSEKLSLVIVTTENEKNKIKYFRDAIVQNIQLREHQQYKSQNPAKQYGYISVSEGINDIVEDDDFDQEFIIELLNELNSINTLQLNYGENFEKIQENIK